MAVQCLAGDEQTAELVAAIDDPVSRQALEAERATVRGLGAGCHSCLAVHIFADEGRWRGLLMAARSDGGDVLRVSAQADSARQAGGQLLGRSLEQGAADRLRT